MESRTSLANASMSGRRHDERRFERILIASDLHSVFLDRQAFKVFLAVASSHQFTRCILNGDFMDCTTISDHARKVGFYNPDVLADYSFDYELSMVQTEILRPLRKALGKDCKLLLRLGNHEWRYIRPNRSNSAALSEIIETCNKRGATRLEDLLKLDKVGATLSYNAVDIL